MRGWHAIAAIVTTLAGGWAAAAEDLSDENPLVASVNGHEVRLADIYRQIESLPLGDQIAVRERLDQFIEAMIREEVLFQMMLATDFEGEPELRERIKTVVVEHLIQRQVRDRIQVSDEEVRAYYEANTSVVREENVAASQIVLATYEECEALLESIDSDAAFAEAAQSRSLDEESAPRGGALGRFMNHAGPYGFEEMLFLLQPGQMAIFESRLGCHLVRITDRELPPLPPLETVRERIHALLARRLERELLRELVERSAGMVQVERPKR